MRRCGHVGRRSDSLYEILYKCSTDAGLVDWVDDGKITRYPGTEWLARRGGVGGRRAREGRGGRECIVYGKSYAEREGKNDW